MKKRFIIPLIIFSSFCCINSVKAVENEDETKALVQEEERESSINNTEEVLDNSVQKRDNTTSVNLENLDEANIDKAEFEKYKNYCNQNPKPNECYTDNDFFDYHISPEDAMKFLYYLHKENQSVAPDKRYDLLKLSYSYEVDEKSIPLNVTVGDKGKIRKIYKYKNVPDLSFDSLYLSEDPSILKVNHDGTWEAISPGKAEISVVPLDNRKAMGYLFFKEIYSKGYKLSDIIDPILADESYTDIANKYTVGRSYISKVNLKEQIDDKKDTNLLSKDSDIEPNKNITVQQTSNTKVQTYNNSVKSNSINKANYKNPKTKDSTNIIVNYFIAFTSLSILGFSYLIKIKNK